jgi:hypothetical protein
MLVPVSAEFLRTSFRIEHAGAFEFNPAGDTGYRVSPPTRPLYIEKYIGCAPYAPYDEGRGYGGPLFYGIREEEDVAVVDELGVNDLVFYYPMHGELHGREPGKKMLTEFRKHFLTSASM